MAGSVTPQDLTITPRDRRFGRGMRQDRWWMGGDPVATAFYNALSATFPKGEAFFVDSVRQFREGTPPKLERGDQGLRHPGGDAQPRARRSSTSGRSRPATTSSRSRTGSNGGCRSPARGRRSSTWRRPCASSISPPSSPTSCSRIRATSPAPTPKSAALWRWHAIEEIEHKGVAYDTWLHATPRLAALASAGRSRPR